MTTVAINVKSRDAAARLWKAHQQAPSETTALALVEHYVPLVRRTVTRMAIYTPPDMDVDDLTQHALMGLWTAIERFDLGKQCAFIPFALLRIRGAVRDALRRHDPLSRTDRMHLKALEKQTLNHLKRYQESPDDQTLAGYTGLEASRIRSLMARAQTWVSLDSVFHRNESGDGDVSLGDVLRDEQAVDPAEETERHDQAARFRQAFRRLPDRQRKLLYLYYYEDLTLKEIGVIFDLTEARICQVHAAALLALRTMLSEAHSGEGGV